MATQKSVTCPCHGEPWYVTRYQRYCRVKLRASWAKTARAYRRTEKGRAFTREANARLIRAGKLCAGHAATRELADQINAHVRRRVDAFKSGQSLRAAVEVPPAAGVPREAGS